MFIAKSLINFFAGFITALLQEENKAFPQLQCLICFLLDAFAFANVFEVMLSVSTSYIGDVEILNGVNNRNKKGTKFIFTPDIKIA